MEPPIRTARHGRRRIQAIIVVALVVGSTVGLALAFTWRNRELAILETHRQIEEWNGATLVLLQVWASFAQFSSVHDEYIRTNEPRLADLGSSVLGILEHTLDEIPDRIAAVIAPLNITSDILSEAKIAYLVVTDTTDRDPALLRSETPANSYLENLTQTLLSVGELLFPLQVDGTDPLEQIGTQNALFIADMMGDIYARSRQVQRGLPL